MRFYAILLSLILLTILSFSVVVIAQGDKKDKQEIKVDLADSLRDVKLTVDSANVKLDGGTNRPIISVSVPSHSLNRLADAINPGWLDFWVALAAGVPVALVMYVAGRWTATSQIEAARVGAETAMTSLKQKHELETQAKNEANIHNWENCLLKSVLALHTNIESLLPTYELVERLADALIEDMKDSASPDSVGFWRHLAGFPLEDPIDDLVFEPGVNYRHWVEILHALNRCRQSIRMLKEFIKMASSSLETTQLSGMPTITYGTLLSQFSYMFATHFVALESLAKEDSLSQIGIQGILEHVRDLLGNSGFPLEKWQQDKLLEVTHHQEQVWEKWAKQRESHIAKSEVSESN